MKKPVLMLFAAVAAFVLVFGFQWYRYVTNTESPYQEIGITLNSRMPDPIRKWGCDRLKMTFGRLFPPHGCAAPGGRLWI